MMSVTAVGRLVCHDVDLKMNEKSY